MTKAELSWELVLPDGKKKWNKVTVDLDEPDQIDLVAQNIKETIEQDLKTMRCNICGQLPLGCNCNKTNHTRVWKEIPMDDKVVDRILRDFHRGKCPINYIQYETKRPGMCTCPVMKAKSQLLAALDGAKPEKEHTCTATGSQWCIACHLDQYQQNIHQLFGKEGESK